MLVAPQEPPLMASSMSTMSLAAACGVPLDKKLAAYNRSAQLSSLASISSSSLSSGRRQVSLSRRSSATTGVRAMAKELYFNKDGSAIKKLQVMASALTCLHSIGWLQWKHLI